MRPTHFAIAAALLAGVGAAPGASAQVLGLPVNNSGVPAGLGLYGDVAFPNGAAGDGTTLAASARLGLGASKIGLTATLASFNPTGPDNTITTVGGTFNYKLLGGPLIPFSATLQGGVGYGKEAGGVKLWHFPIGLGFAITIPNPALAIKPWIATAYPSPASASAHRARISGSSSTIRMLDARIPECLSAASGETSVGWRMRAHRHRVFQRI